MQAIVQAAIPDIRIAAVIANRPDAAGLAFAREHGIDTRVVDHRHYAAREDFDQALAGEIDDFAPDLLVLAGFMRILTAGFTQRYNGRMLNIHPSLLPAFTGLDTHRRAIDAGCKLAGCTVHFVTAELDHGPIVAQAALPILAQDDADSLAKRVLTIEHQLYPQVIRWFAADQLEITGNRVKLHTADPAVAPVLISPAG